MRDGEQRPCAVVTGAGGGLGGAVVEALRTDWDVVALSRTGIPVVPGVESRCCDLTDLAGLAQAVAGLPRVDAIVHCAAVSPRFALAEADREDWERTFAVNVFAPALLTRALLPQLREARGRIVFVSSGAGLRGVAGHTVYAASKHALMGLAHSFLEEERDHGVQVSTVSPGAIRTDMRRRDIGAALACADEFHIEPASLARTIRALLEAPRDLLVSDVVVRPQRER